METVKDKLSDNELIAKFMGIPTIVDAGGNIWYDFQKTGKLIYSIKADELRYSTSWDWLMPVVEKIESITGGRVKIRGVECEINIVDYYDLQIEKSKIRAVYKAVVEFIKWFNTQTPSPNEYRYRS